MKRSLLALAMTGMLAISCTSKESLKKMLKEDPTILTEAIEANPDVFIESLNNAVKLAQGKMAEKRQKEEQQKLEDSYNSPLVPVLRGDESYRGPKDAPITLVEYSDFECPFCSRGFTTVMSLLEKYPGKIRFVYKHLPLSFHQQAMISSQYYEAIRIQNPETAFKFHDDIYKNQAKLRNGEAYLKSLAKSLNVDMKKLEKDLNSDAVKKRIQEDMEEANKFGMQGTPGFVINGIPVKGAYPVDHFDGIISELKKRGKISI